MLWLWIIFIYILVAETYVYCLSRNRLKANASANDDKNSTDIKIDIIILLGANGDIQSPVTRDRALNAAVAKEHFPQARFLLTGNENKNEISTYKKLLAEHGYFEFIIETESTTTWENMKLSKELLKTLSSHEDRVIIVTSEYHQRRALAMARSLGFNADIFGKDPRKYEKAPLYFLKERLSVLKYFPQMLFAKIF